MKYFTKDELEDITNKLIENPTRETLKNLNDIYNGNSVMEQTLVNDNNLVVEVVPAAESLYDVSIAPKQNEVVNEVLPNVGLNEQVISPVSEIIETPVENVLPNISIPNTEISNIDNTINNNVNNSINSSMNVSNFELPKLETEVFNNQNNEQVNFNGNLFEPIMQNIGNLMQTTDNFNTNPNTTPNTEVSVATAPFFGVSNEPVNNPIQVDGPLNTEPVLGQSMFGEMQQNYM